jgi:hypothetical protein
MYLQALDLKRGLIPHKEVVIYYGYLTSWIQGAAMSLLGERLLSIGLVTGFFYALSIWLLYCLGKVLLPKSLAFLSALLMFLLHAYIIYPWANYFTYTFLLASLLCLVNRDQTRHASRLTVLSGLFAGLAVLTRYSSVHTVLLPFLFFFLIQFFLDRTRWKSVALDAIAWSLGLAIPVGLFLLLLVTQGAFSDLLLQTRTLAEAWGRGVSITNSIPLLLTSILSRTGLMASSYEDPRILFFYVNFFWCGIALLYFLSPPSFTHGPSGKVRNDLILIGLAALVGYLNATHTYEVFRLVNGASLGILIIFYTIFHLTNFIPKVSGKALRKILLIPLATYYLILSSTLILTRTTSVYWPWNWVTLRKENVAEIRMHIFAGKILPQSYYDFYWAIAQTAADLDLSYVVTNYTMDPLAAAVTKLPRAQKAATFVPALAQAYPEEVAKIDQLIRSNKALILSPVGKEDLKLSPFSTDVGSNQTVFQQAWPPVVPWLSGVTPVNTGANPLLIFKPVDTSKLNQQQNLNESKN